MNWKEICRIWRSVPRHKRAAALADAFRAWADLYHGNMSEFEDVCEFLAEVLDGQAVKEPGEARAREARRGWVIIENSDMDGGLNG